MNLNNKKYREVYEKPKPIFYRTGKYDHKIRLRFARDICSYNS